MKKLSDQEIIDTINQQEGNPADYNPFNEWDWEHYCGACDNFGDEVRCPRNGQVYEDTRWTDFDCKDFWD